MRIILATCFLLVLISEIKAQQLVSNELGYQEFTTTITSSTGDEFGNFYYTGNFKGELKINGQVLATGIGDLDIFLVKMDSSGNVVWHKTFGNELPQGGRGVYYLNGALYITCFSRDSLRMGGNLLAPYPGSDSYNAVSKFSASSGEVVWSRRTNMNWSIFGFGADIRLTGSVFSSSSVKWGDQVLLDTASGFRQVFVQLDTSSGDIRSTYKFSAANPSITIHHVEQLSANRIFMCLRTVGVGTLAFNGENISLPSTGQQLIFIKADTNLTGAGFKVLNPGSNIAFQLGATRSNLAFSRAKDSIYFIANSNSSGDNIFYNLDGYNLSLFRKNALIAMDTQFNTRRAIPISVHPTPQNSVQYKSIACLGNDLYLVGQISGNNQAPPVVPYPTNVVNVDLLPGLSDTINLEGPSQSFIIKTSPTFTNARIKWLGTHSVYENPSLLLSHLTNTDSKLSFLHSADNIWNPWIVDSALLVRQGQMKANADRAETLRFVEHLSDGSLIIAGSSHGKTLLDTSYQNIGMGASRNDFFILRRAVNGSVTWYKRVYSSFTGASVTRFFVQNEKIYVLLALGQGVNRAGSNYLKLDTTVLFSSLPTQTTYRVLLVIQPNGTSKMIPLDDNLPSGRVADIDIYPNGDIAAVTGQAANGMQLGSLQYPNNIGFFFLRLDSTGSIKQALKVYRASALPGSALPLQMNSVRINRSDTTLFVGGLYAMNIGQPDHQYLIHNGASVVDTITTKNYFPTSNAQIRYTLFLKTDLLSSNWESVLGPGIGANGPECIAQVGTNMYYTFSKSQVGPMLVNGQVIDADTVRMSGLISFNSSGGVKGVKLWKDVQRDFHTFRPVRLKTIDRHLYISGGIVAPLLFDTISVSHMGFQDALTLKYDSNLIAKQSHRLATPYTESMYDISIFQDSLYAFAYTAQRTPTYYSNRLMGNPLDLDENAFLGSFSLAKKTVPVVPVTKFFLLYPNPNSGIGFNLLSRSGTNTNYSWQIFDMAGRLMAQGKQVLTAGTPSYMLLKKNLSNGYYYLSMHRPDGITQEVIRFLVVK